MIVMLLGGLWHGAAWSYMVWGGFHGLALTVEKLLSSKTNIFNHRAYDFIKILSVFILVSIAWLLFKLPNFEHTISYLRAIVLNSGTSQRNIEIALILFYSSPVILSHIIYMVKEKYYTMDKVKKSSFVVAVMLFLLISNAGTPAPFVYFQF